MADSDSTLTAPAVSVGNVEPVRPQSLDETRALARRRFKERLERGERIGDCDCSSQTDVSVAANGAEPTVNVAGIRFLDSGRTYYFDPRGLSLSAGDWVVVETSRGKEAGRVIIAPHQVRISMLQGDVRPILRRLSDDDVRKMERLKREAANAVKTFGAKIRERGLPMKPISAEYNFDGTHLTLNFSAPERVDFRDLAKDLAATFRCRVELRQVGPRDEARLLGGLGRCGRTLCCSSWLPVFPEISMNMAKTQDLPLNPSKISGVCGRLLCCLSYENEQYKQAKAVLPRLGQTIDTPRGPGTVVALQVLKELVTVRLAADGVEVAFPAAELGLKRPEMISSAAPKTLTEEVPSPAREPEPVAVTAPVAAERPLPTAGGRRRRRGRAGRRQSADANA